jgi:hypothetical protein
MEEVRALSLTGMLGSGYLQSSLARGLSWAPHFIGCDAGTTDSGAFSLATGICAFSRTAVARDLRPALRAARHHRIPLIIGSAGTAGADLNLAWTAQIVRELATEEGLHFRLAVIRAEQHRPWLKKRLSAGAIRLLEPLISLDEGVIDRSEHIVGMMGAEPLMAAIDAGAEVIVAGRCSDTAIFAAIPLRHGLPPGPSWHAGKILECGAAAVNERKRPDCLFAVIRHDGFVVKPPNPDYACTPLSVAAHSLYENADPFRFVEPSGTVDVGAATYEEAGAGAVRVSGSRFVPSEKYSVKLEGAEKVGFQTIVLGGVRDPLIIAQIESWITRLRERVAERAAELIPPEDRRGCSFAVRVYGRNGVMGPAEPAVGTTSHELLLILEATAGSQETATTVATSARHVALHLPIPEWRGSISTLAFPYAPAHVERGAVYRYTLNCVVETDDPCQMFPIQLEEL